jgi:hypothetical protein
VLLPSQNYDLLFVAPTVGVASTFLKGPVDPVKYVKLDVTARYHNKNLKARYAKAQMQKAKACLCYSGQANPKIAVITHQSD